MVMPSDTPRVDDLETLAENFHGMVMVVNAVFARLLERELNEAKAMLHFPNHQQYVQSLKDSDDYRVKLSDALRDYNELIYAVERKFPGETRHQTALKYIQQMERRCLDVTAGQSAIAAKEQPCPS